MPIHMTVTLHAESESDVSKLALALASLGGADVTVTPNAAAAKPVRAERATPAKAETKAAEPAPEPEAEEAKDDSDLIDGDGPTIDDVKDAAKAYNVKNGRDALAQLIQDHGGSKGVTTIPEGNYQAFIDGAA